MKDSNKRQTISFSLSDILKANESSKKIKKETLDPSLLHLLRSDTFTDKTNSDDFDIVVQKIAKKGSKSSKAEQDLENINPNLLDFSNETDELLFTSDDFKDDPLTKDIFDSEHENFFSL